MKKFHKMILFTAIGFLILGIALYAGAVAATGYYGLTAKNFPSFSGFRHSGDHTEQTVTIEKPFQSIDIEDITCDIVLVFSEGEAPSVRYTDSSDYRHQIRLDERTLEIKVQEVGGFWNNFFGGIPEKHTMTITLPFSVLDGLELSNVSGNVILEQLTIGKLHLESVSGEVYMTDVNVTDLAELSTVSGSIHLDRFDCNKLDAESVSGNVTGTISSPKSIRTETMSGDVYVSENRSDAPKWDIHTISGNIHITVAP